MSLPTEGQWLEGSYPNAQQEDEEDRVMSEQYEREDFKEREANTIRRAVSYGFDSKEAIEWRPALKQWLLEYADRLDSRVQLRYCAWHEARMPYGAKHCHRADDHACAPDDYYLIPSEHVEIDR